MERLITAKLSKTCKIILIVTIFVNFAIFCSSLSLHYNFCYLINSKLDHNYIDSIENQAFVGLSMLENLYVMN